LSEQKTDRLIEPSPRPQTAAAVLLVRENANQGMQIFWAQRSQKLSFLAGFRALPGGRRELADEDTRVENCADERLRAMIACAARELFEETGVLIARGGERLTKGQRASLLDDLNSHRMTFAALLTHFGLYPDARDFIFIGRWMTPPFSQRRFDTWFFLVRVPGRQEPHLTADGELENGEWIAPRRALELWRRGEAVMAAPLLHILRTLEKFCANSNLKNSTRKTSRRAAQSNETNSTAFAEELPAFDDELIESLRAAPEAQGAPSRAIQFLPHIHCAPLRTPTLPPATHTNCFLIVGAREIVVIDPASPFADEQRALASSIDKLCEGGKRRVREIILTHEHPDHIGGVEALKEYLGEVRVAAHELTAEALRGKIEVNHFVADNEVIELENDVNEPPILFRALHTPGHARGHLCFYDERTGALISGDNVTGLPTVFVGAPEGDMRAYLASLERMKNLPRLNLLLGSHGAPIAAAQAQIERYIAHRLDRERQILVALEAGANTLSEIVARVYGNLADEKLQRLAAKTAQAHLIKLKEENRLPEDFDFN
jgi:ribonuclease/clavin/mitogillin